VTTRGTTGSSTQPAANANSAERLAKILGGSPDLGSYGYSDPEGQGGRHLALDWFGTGNVASPATGRIVRVAPSKEHGKTATGQVFGGIVSIRDPQKNLWVLRHIDPYGANLKVGQQVSAGQRLGIVQPWSGKSHIHLETYKPGTSDITYDPRYAVNPASLYKRYGIKL
jgi:murein DD-endopeptidase MepM/ murein hydrolase activator NlpD